MHLECFTRFLFSVPFSLGFLSKMNCRIYLHAVVLQIMYSQIFFFVCTQLVGHRYSFLIRKWQDSKPFFSAFLFKKKKSVFLPKELQTKIEGKHVVTNNFWIISLQMLSDDFENFAGKTQTFQVKQNPSDQQFPVCACSFCFVSFPLLSYLLQGKSKMILILHSCRRLCQSSVYFSS